MPINIFIYSTFCCILKREAIIIKNGSKISKNYIYVSLFVCESRVKNEVENIICIIKNGIMEILCVRFQSSAFFSVKLKFNQIYMHVLPVFV